MLSFESDYNNGAHPLVMKHLVETNQEVTLTYGFDAYSERAKERIKAACETPEAEVYFLMGGTQANATVIDGMLRSYEAVVCAETAHINVHEATAVEANGHKVIALPSHDGKLEPNDLDRFLQNFENDESRDHCAQPGLVYITFPTELGTIYRASEIEQIREISHRYGLPLFVDGARLGYGLMCPDSDITLPWLAHHCDAFYIGGTKQGALCGEAVVFTHANAPRAFFTIIKRHGALLAKGRLVGVQFDALFTDELYFKLSHHAIEMAFRLRGVLRSKGYPFYLDSPTNQQFVVIPNEDIEPLLAQVKFTRWCPYDEHHTVCRFVTSWATTDDEIQLLASILGV